MIWAESYLLAGRFFGDVAKRSAPLFHLLSRFALGIFVLLVVGLMVHRVYKNRRFLIELRASRIEPAELLAMLRTAHDQGNTPPFIVDLRHPLDYLPDPRVLPGALRLGPTELAAHSEIIPRDRDVILYCTCPSEETSAKVAQQLLKLGIHRVRPLRGGFEVWRDLGYPLEDYVERAVFPATTPSALATPA